MVSKVSLVSLLSLVSLVSMVSIVSLVSMVSLLSVVSMVSMSLWNVECGDAFPLYLSLYRGNHDQRCFYIAVVFNDKLL